MEQKILADSMFKHTFILFGKVEIWWYMSNGFA